MWAQYKLLLEHHPFKTNAFVTGILLMASDSIAQVYVEDRHFLQRPELKQDDEDDIKMFDFTRNFRMGFMGVVVSSPLRHLWYGKTLPRLVPHPSRTLPLWSQFKVRCKQVLIDQSFWAPINISSLFVANEILSGYPELAVQKLQHDFWPTWTTALTCWPIFNLVNFTFVPHAHRILVINFCSFFWNIYLCLMANKTEHVGSEAHVHGISRASSLDMNMEENVHLNLSNQRLGTDSETHKQAVTNSW